MANEKLADIISSGDSKRSMSHTEIYSTDQAPSVSEPVLEVYYPNRWSKIRAYIKEPAAEFLGVMILIIFGAGVDCQTVLTTHLGVASGPKGDYLALAWGWGMGTAMGVWVSGGASGGHINPAITITLATFRGFPWKKVPVYISAQVMGGLVGAAIVYGNYWQAISIFEGGDDIRTLATAGLFTTFAAEYLHAVSAFFDEFLGTAVLTLVVFAVNDKRNSPPAGLAPFVIGLLVLAIGVALGFQTGYAINPARDLGPRIFTAMAGYGKQVFTFRNHYWIWCPIIAPILGSLTGALVYDTLVYTGEDSILNKPSKKNRVADVECA